MDNMKTKEERFEEIIKRTLSMMPEDFKKWASKRVQVVYPIEKNLACMVPKSDSKHFKAFIILYDELLTVGESEQEYNVLHEFAHLKLKHRTQVDKIKEQQQEKEAKELALFWWSTAQTNKTLKELQINADEMKKRCGV